MSKRSRFGLPSPAFVLSMLALILALGGTALAAGSVSTATKHADTKQDKKLIKKMAKSLSVKHAKTAGSANTAANATHATSADSATNATNATHATSATSATHATSADSATNATHATSATSATHATSADSATNATHATSADSATHATSADSAANGIFGTGAFFGYVGSSIAGLSSVYVFVGPTITATTTANERLVGSAEAPLGSSGTTTILYGLCYQPSGGGPITNFVGGGYSIGQVGPTRISYAAAASVVPGAGTFKVGYCVENVGANPLDNNDYVNGWVQVVNKAATSSPITSNIQSSRSR